MSLPSAAREVLDFWFGAASTRVAEYGKTLWFVKNASVDSAIRRQFLQTYAAAVTEHLSAWRDSALGSLALIIVLDQLPRNMFRDTSRAFAADALARELAVQAIKLNFDRELGVFERAFMYLPFEHSENLADQERSIELFEGLREYPEAAEMIRYAHLHYEVIERFGRFPHRNQVLGRESTAAEREFLTQPGSAF